MDLAALWGALDAAGVSLSAEGERIRAEPSSGLTDAMRSAIRAHRWQVLGGIETRTELARLLTALRCGPEHPDHREALAFALSDPATHLACLRESARIETSTTGISHAS